MDLRLTGKDQAPRSNATPASSQPSAGRRDLFGPVEEALIQREFSKYSVAGEVREINNSGLSTNGTATCSLQ